MKDFWDARYGEKDYAYGTAPNVFFSEEIQKLKPGKALFPAEGEGRNAVFGAGCGWEIMAFDQSEEGKKKALQLARQKGVKIEYAVTSLEDFEAAEESFDALVLIFAHFPARVRNEFHRKLASTLKPGGILILEGFSKRHLEFNSINPQAGGPKDLGMLFSKDELLEDFSGFRIQFLEETIVNLHEGEFHSGESAVVRLVAVKK
jgi:SAM-dependent methyltransferase